MRLPFVLDFGNNIKPKGRKSVGTLGVERQLSMPSVFICEFRAARPAETIMNLDRRLRALARYAGGLIGDVN